MRRIELVSLTLENFRSFQERTSVTLTQGAGLKFISGNNQASPRMGANGVGKSTLWDALVWCCFGYSTRGLRAGELVSWGTKQPIVLASFHINGSLVVIKREGAPNRITISGKPAEQADVDRCLGSSRLRFLQSVIYGQMVPLFVDLSVPERGALLDEVLDIGIWMEASILAGKAHAQATNDRNEADRILAYEQGRLAGLPDRAAIEAESTAWEARLNSQIDLAINEVDKAERELIVLKNALIKATAAVSQVSGTSQLNVEISRLQASRAALEAAYQIKWAEMSAAQKDIAFFQHTKTCPTCGQAISRTMVDRNIREANNKITRIKVDLQANGVETRDVVEKLEDMQGEWAKLIRKREFLVSQQATAAQAIAGQERLIDAASKAVEQIAASSNPHDARLAQLEQDRKAIEIKLSAANAAKRRAMGTAIKTDFWQAAFKRVRLFVVRRILAHLELEVGNAANLLGLIGWRIVFTTELETKSGTLRPGIHIQVHSPESSAAWEAWSGGEGQRIRLAVTLGMASLIHRLAGVDYGFEVFDEPTAFLSDIGIDDLIETLKHRAVTSNKSLWLCDHRALNIASFDETWMVTKTDQGSSIAMISASEG